MLCCSVASADLGITDRLTDIVVGGLNKFLIGLSDDFYEQSYRPKGTEEFNGTATEIWIYGVTTHTYDPWKSASIKDFRKLTILMCIVYCSIYSSTGGLYVIVSMLSSSGGNLMDSMLNRSSAFRTVRIKEYFENLAVSIGVLAFTDVFMKAMFTLNYFLTSLFIVSCFEVKSLSPSTDNVILYVSIGIFYNTLNHAMEIRHIILDMFVMGSFIIGMLLISNKTRNTGLSIGWYCIGILFLQTIIVFLTTAGFISVEVICANRGIIAGSAAEISLYFVLLIILIGVTLAIMVGLVTLRKTAVKTVRLVI